MYHPLASTASSNIRPAGSLELQHPSHYSFDLARVQYILDLLPHPQKMNYRDLRPVSTFLSVAELFSRILRQSFSQQNRHSFRI